MRDASGTSGGIVCWGEHLVLLAALLVELALLLGGRVLVLLVLGHKIVHVRLGLGELHFVHALTSVPMQKALRRNIEVNCSATRLNISWIAVELPMKVADILRPFGGMSQMDDLMLHGIHSMKYEEFLFCTLSICSSTSFDDMRPRKRPAAVRYRPWRGSAAHIMFFASNICCVSSGTVNARYCWEPRDVSGAKPFMKKCRRGKGTMFVPSLRRSQLSWPGKRMEQVMPDNPALTKWFKSP